MTADGASSTVGDLTDDELETKLQAIADGKEPLATVTKDLSATPSSFGLKLSDAGFQRFNDAKPVPMYLLWGTLNLARAGAEGAASGETVTAKCAVVLARGLDTGKPDKLQVIVVVDVAVSMSLRLLPVVGDSVGGVGASLIGVQLVGLTLPLDDTTFKAVNDVIKKHTGSPTVPERAKTDPWKAGVYAAARYKVGAQEMPALALRLERGGTEDAKAAEDPPKAALPGPLSRFGGSLTYLPEVAKKDSPAHQDVPAAVKFGVDGTIAFGPLELSLLGAGFTVPASGGEPQASLDGFGVAYVNPGEEGLLKVVGALLWDSEARRQGYDFKLDGILMLTVPFAALQVAGSYARIPDEELPGQEKKKGFSSFFAFASANKFKIPLGPVTLQGLMLGGGMNSKVRLPQVTEVGTFPFLNYLDSGKVEGADTAAEVLKKLCGTISGKAAWVTPKEGDNWIAAGVDLAVAESITGRCLALAEFGDSGLAVALMGILDCKVPREPPAGQKANVSLELQMLAQFQEGLLAVACALTDKSYVLDDTCRVTGGAAMYLWTAGEHKGDSVFTVGGYNPHFQVPTHYPKVPRVGVAFSKWGLTFSGDAYVAKLPRALMLGAGLAVTQDLNWCRWWISAGLNLWCEWDPFFLLGDVRISVGVAATINLGLFRIDVSAELGIDASFWWVPEHGGAWHVSLWAISFSGSWGHGYPSDKPPVSWDQFKRQIPAPLKARPKKDLQPDEENTHLVTGASETPPRDVYSTHGFTFETDASGPISTLLVNGDPWPGLTSKDTFNLAPMGDDGKGMTSEHCLDIYTVPPKGKRELYDVRTRGWQFKKVMTNRPTGLYQPGGGKEIGLKDPKQLIEYFTGVDVTAPPPVRSEGSIVVEAGQLAFSPIFLHPGNDVLPEKRLSPEGPWAERGTGDIRSAVAEDLTSEETGRAREQLTERLSGAGIDLPKDLDTDLKGLASAVRHLWTEVPLLGQAA